MGKFTDDPSQFKTEALKMLREAATQKGLAVWCGEFKGFFFPYDQSFDCPVVGTGSGKELPDSSLFLLVIRFEPAGTMRYESKKQGEIGETGGGTIPTGGIHNPLEALEKLIAKLPSPLPPK